MASYQERDTRPTVADTPSVPDVESAIAMLHSLLEGDEAEQRETLNYLKKALDEDRLSNRKLFP